MCTNWSIICLIRLLIFFNTGAILGTFMERGHLCISNMDKGRSQISTKSYVLYLYTFFTILLKFNPSEFLHYWLFITFITDTSALSVTLI